MKRALLVLCVVICAACGPKCLRGHKEPVWVPPYTQLMPMNVGEVHYFIPIYHSGHWGTRFVCDQLELEKE